MAVFLIPPILTEADWNKNKGVIAKMAGETGIGAALKKLSDLHKPIDFTKFTAGGYGKLHNDKEVDEALKQAKALYAAKIEPLRKQLFAISALATTVAAKFKANKLIPASSTKHVLDLGKAASDFAVEMKSMDAEFKSFEALKLKLAEQIKGQRALIKTSMTKLAAGIKATLANPTKEEWNTSMKQQCRSICNGIKVVPEWNQAYWSTWSKNDGETFFGKLKGKPEDKPMIEAEVKRIAGDLKELAKGLGG